MFPFDVIVRSFKERFKISSQCKYLSSKADTEYISLRSNKVWYLIFFIKFYAFRKFSGKLSNIWTQSANTPIRLLDSELRARMRPFPVFSFVRFLQKVEECWWNDIIKFEGNLRGICAMRKKSSTKMIFVFLLAAEETLPFECFLSIDTKGQSKGKC